MTDIIERLENLNDALLACGNDYSDILLDAVNEIRQIRQQLAECQAREKVLRDTLTSRSKDSYSCGILVDDLLAIPSNSTALDAMLEQAKHEALIEYAELRRMAEELK